MIKIDLHVHSKYSEYQKPGIVKQMGVAESYSELEEIYQTLLNQGMSYVTVTDHDTIEGVKQLKNKYPDKVIMGVETTAIFPEDGCQVHILIFNFNEDQFNEIQRNRYNIYHLRDYIRWANLPYAIAHPTYPVDGKLTLSHIEKLLLIFDIFEGIDSWMSASSNETWNHLLDSLTPERMNELRQQYGIETFSDTPWIKGRIGGSNDHSELYLGKAYTNAEGESIDDLAKAIVNKTTYATGSSGDFRTHALSSYRVAWEYSKKKGGVLYQVIIQSMNEHVFNSKTIDLWKKYKLHRYVTKFKQQEIEFQISLVEMGKSVSQNDTMPSLKTTVPFDKMSEMVDAFFSLLFNSIEKDVKRGKLLKLLKNLSLSVPGILMVMPFLYSMRQLFSDNQLLFDIRKNYTLEPQDKTKKILWFSDTIFDLNGVAVILKNILEYSSKNKYPIYIVGSIEIEHPEFTTLINLPNIYSFRLPFYKSYTMLVPSIVKSLEMIIEAQPDEIILSTPGPVGLIGWIAARLMKIKCTSIYHTDYAAQAKAINNQPLVIELMEELSVKFYSEMDEILVPTKIYIDMLTKQGFEPSKLKLLPSGINTEVFAPDPTARQFLMDEYSLNEGIFILFTGRISKDKNIDILLSAFSSLALDNPDITLLVVGEGPYRKKAMRKYDDDNIIFTGMIPYDDLHQYYAGCDLFVFPSTTDTYGLSVMEAQSCGLPALVSNVGGPQEVIVNEVTGYILPDVQLETWKSKMAEMIVQIRSKSPQYQTMKANARKHIIETCSWEMFFNQMMGGRSL